MSITSDLPNIRVRLEPDQFELLRKIAKLNERTMTQEIRLAVRNHLEGMLQAEAARERLSRAMQRQSS